MATTASRSQYMLHATDAANAEQKCDYKVAAVQWKTAEAYAPNELESHWASARAEFCEMRIEEEVIA